MLKLGHVGQCWASLCWTKLGYVGPVWSTLAPYWAHVEPSWATLGFVLAFVLDFCMSASFNFVHTKKNAFFGAALLMFSKWYWLFLVVFFRACFHQATLSLSQAHGGGMEQVEF